VLHTALRSDFAGGAAIQAEVRASRKKLSDFADACAAATSGDHGKQSGMWSTSASAVRIWAIAVCDALRHEWSGASRALRIQRRSHAARGFDAYSRSRRTLVLVCSKTFVTQELSPMPMRTGVMSARWARSPRPITSSRYRRMHRHGCVRHRSEHRSRCGLGGRTYSVWSASALAELTIGSEKFQEFLSGAGEIDTFHQRSVRDQLPC